MHLKGSTGKQLALQGAVQLCLDQEYVIYLKKIMKYLNENAKRKDKKTYLPVNEFNGIDKAMNEKLYQVFIDKLSKSIYQYRPANPKEKLIKQKEKFCRISIEEQCIVLGEILHLFQCKSETTGNLTFINESASTGKLQINKNISNVLEINLINQSILGIYEQKINLQKI